MVVVAGAFTGGCASIVVVVLGAGSADGATVTLFSTCGKVVVVTGVVDPPHTISPMTAKTMTMPAITQSPLEERSGRGTERRLASVVLSVLYAI